MKIAELVLKSKQNDNEAKSKLCEQTYNLAYFHALKLIKNQDDALDIVQDSYVKAFSNLDMLDSPERFTSWLTSIVLNKSKDYLKKKKPTLFVEMQNDDFDSDIDFEDDKTEFQPEAQVDYSETKAIISDMVDSLPEDQRACVIMFYFEEMSVLEIASVMNLSENTIKSKLFYARKKIKNQVLEMEHQYGVKLYSAAPIPFIIWVLRQQAANTSISPEAAAQIVGTVTGGSAGAVTATGTTAATNTGVAATSSVSKAASAITSGILKAGSIKLIAGIAAGVVVATGIGVAAYQSNKKPDEAAIQRAMAILVNDPAFLDNSARSLWGSNYSGYSSTNGSELLDRINNINPNAQSVSSTAASESSLSSESSAASEAEPEEKPAAQEDTFTMSIYGHEVQFPVSYEGKIHIKEGVDSMGDKYASIYYKPLYDRAQQGENLNSLRSGEVMYTDLWTRNYYDNHIKAWFDKCTAQGSFTDPIPDQRAISFKSDTILVSMHFVDAPSSTAQSDPDIAEFAKLMEIVKESCKGMQARNLPLDQPDYDLYLKAWWEGTGISYSGELYTESIFLHNVKLPVEWKDKLLFADTNTWENPLPRMSNGTYFPGIRNDPMFSVCEEMNNRIERGEIPLIAAFYRPIYDRALRGEFQFKGDILCFFAISRNEYNDLVKYWYDECQNNNFKYFMMMVGGVPISIGEESVLCCATRYSAISLDDNDPDAIGYHQLLVNEMLDYFDGLFTQEIKSNQPNYDRYLKTAWEELERKQAELLAELEQNGE